MSDERRAADEPPTRSSHSWVPTRLDLAALQPTATPDLLGVLYRGLRHLVSGEPESCKGWFGLVAAITDLHAGRSVLWIDFEQGAAMTLDRLRALGATDDEVARMLFVTPREPLVDKAVRADVEALIADRDPSLVVIDAYAGLLGVENADPNSERDIEAVNRRVVDLLRAKGATTVVLDHLVKDTQARGRYSTGSGRKLAEVDVHLRLDRALPFGRGRHGSVRITVLKDRPGGLPHPRAGELHLHSDAASGAITWEITPPTADVDQPQAFRRTGYMERVSRWLELRHEPISGNLIEQGVTGTGQYIRDALATLVEEGHVTRTPGANRGFLYASKTAYREADDTSSSVRRQSVDSSSADEVDSSSVRRGGIPPDVDALDEAPQDELLGLTTSKATT